MALDTRGKRISMINFGVMIGPRIFLHPAGAGVSGDDRKHILYLYRGIDLDEPVIPPVSAVRIERTEIGRHGVLAEPRTRIGRGI